MEKLFTHVLAISISVSPVIVLAALLSGALDRRYSVKWRYFVWLVIAVRLIIPLGLPALQSPVSISLNETAERSPYVALQKADRQTTSENAAPSDTSQSEGTVTPQPSVPRPSMTGVAALVWLCGTLAFIVYSFSGYLYFRLSIRRWSVPVTDSKTLSLFEELKANRNIRARIRLLCCKKAETPMLTGFFRPVILVPHGNLDDTSLALMLDHELVHLKRCDVWCKLLLVAAKSVHWFNPFVWYMERRAGTDMEMACDCEVVRQYDGEGRRRYNEALLSSVCKRRGPALSASLHGNVKSMKERFAHVADTRTKKAGILIVAAAVLICLLVGNVVAFRSDGGYIDHLAAMSGGDSIVSLSSRTYVFLDGDKTRAVLPFYIPERQLETARYDITAANFDPNVLTGSAASYQLSDDILAVAYAPGGDENGGRTVDIAVSADAGKTWVRSSIDRNFSYVSIGFTTKQDGWLVLAQYRGMGSSDKAIFRTSDGGGTWTETPGVENCYHGLPTGSAFATPDIGLICYRYYEDTGPEVHRTEDGGSTWQRLKFDIPQEYADCTFMPASPVFTGQDGILPVIVGGDDGHSGVMTFKTSDSGETWTFLEFSPSK